MVTTAESEPEGERFPAHPDASSADRALLARTAGRVRRHLYLVPAVYFLLAASWILFSDYALSFLGDHELEMRLQSVKGLLYVLVTTALLALLVRGQFRRLVGVAEGLARVSAEREELLREVHHRVKNNLQVMESLLRLQAGALDDPVCAEVLTRAGARFRSMALVHESLYESPDMGAVDFAAYLGRLGAFLGGQDRAPGVPELAVVAQAALLPITRAVPCGMIAGELIAAALRREFPADGGRVEVYLARGDGALVLSVISNGRPGAAAGCDFGATLVEMLARQVGGDIERMTDGTGWRLRFPERA